MADVILGIEEVSILVSSDLPPSFLAGLVTAENNTDEFPHDPSDITCIPGTKSSATSASIDRVTFRTQISLSNCSLKVLPVQAYTLSQDELSFSNLIAPANVTMMMSLEHKIEKEASHEIDQSGSYSLVVSVLIHQLESNIDLRSIYAALETFKYHAKSFMKKDGSSDETLAIHSKTVKKNNWLILCIHVPDLEINIWALTTQSKHTLLSRVKANQFEYRMEYTELLSSQHNSIREGTIGTVHKCVISSGAVEICSPIKDADSPNFKMVEILSLGSRTSELSHLAERISVFCQVDGGSKEGVGTTVKKGFVLRSEYDSHDSPSMKASFATSSNIFASS